MNRTYTPPARSSRPPSRYGDFSAFDVDGITAGLAAVGNAAARSFFFANQAARLAAAAGSIQVGDFGVDADTGDTWLLAALPSSSGGNWHLVGIGSGMTNPMSAPEDLIVGGVSGSPARLPVGLVGQTLQVLAGPMVGWGPSGGGGSGWPPPFALPSTFTPPSLSGFTSILSSAGGIDGDMPVFSTGQGITMTNGCAGSVAAGWGILVDNNPYTITNIVRAYFNFVLGGADAHIGLILRNSVSGNFRFWGLYQAAGAPPVLQLEDFNPDGSSAGVVGTPKIVHVGDSFSLGINRVLISTGQQYGFEFGLLSGGVRVAQSSPSGGIGGVPDQVGFGVTNSEPLNHGTGGSPYVGAFSQMDIFHWRNS